MAGDRNRDLRDDNTIKTGVQATRPQRSLNMKQSNGSFNQTLKLGRNNEKGTHIDCRIHFPVSKYNLSWYSCLYLPHSNCITCWILETDNSITGMEGFRSSSNHLPSVWSSEGSIGVCVGCTKGTRLRALPFLYVLGSPHIGAGATQRGVAMH